MEKDTLYSNIMNIPCTRTMSHFANREEMLAYKEGHRDARHAAADLVCEAYVVPLLLNVDGVPIAFFDWWVDWSKSGADTAARLLT